MPRKVLSTPDAPAPVGPYSQGVVAGGFLYSAGFGPQDPVTGEVPDTVEGQTAQVLRNVESLLRAAGGGLEDVVKVNAYLAELNRDFDAYNGVYAEFFEEPYPARTTVGAELLGILVEIEVVAYVGSGPGSH